jgi:hypothetical protein
MSLVINTKEPNTYELQNELVQDNRDRDSKGGGILAYINTDFFIKHVGFKTNCEKSRTSHKSFKA